MTITHVLAVCVVDVAKPPPPTPTASEAFCQMGAALGEIHSQLPSTKKGGGGGGVTEKVTCETHKSLFQGTSHLSLIVAKVAHAVVRLFRLEQQRLTATPSCHSCPAGLEGGGYRTGDFMG